ncbi:MAG: hypothetical protein WAU88_04050 [Candidatus Zixiibacteriota bacterium]
MRKFACLICLLMISSSAFALVQPDISAIGDFRAFTGNWKNLDSTKTPRNGTFNMSFQELELAIAGYLNPFAKAWVTVSSPGDGFEIEEAYGTIFKGLPLKSELRAGQFLVDFGKLNSNHVHAFPFVDRPLAERVLLGGDGFKDQGVNWNLLLPTKVYSKLSLSILRGGIFGALDAPDDPLDGRYTQQPIYAGRLNFFLPVGEKGDLDLGFSGLFGRYKGKGAYGTGDDLNGFRNLNATMAGIDAKYKHRWNDYSSLVLQGELITNHRTIFTDQFSSISNYGAFAFVDYRFRKRYNVGFMFDRAPGIYDNTADDYEQNVPDDLSNTPHAPFDSKNSTTAYSLYTGFSLLEETTLFRLVARWVDYHIADPAQLIDPSMTRKQGEFSLVLQMIWSIGPHKPHEF